MIVLDVLYVAIATVGVMLSLQLITFFVVRLLYPPEPKIIYRNLPVPHQQPQVIHTPPPPPPPVFTQPTQEIQLPEYDPRKPSSDSLRLDAVLPDGIQETRPPGI